MNATRKAWIVATSIAAVEALKDQGICRWNYSIRSLQQHAQNKIRSCAQAKMLSSSSSSSSSSKTSASLTTTMGANEMRRAKMKKREECMEKVMGLSCWGPSTTRF